MWNILKPRHHEARPRYISGLHGVVVTSEFYGSMPRLLGPAGRGALSAVKCGFAVLPWPFNRKRFANKAFELARHMLSSFQEYIPRIVDFPSQLWWFKLFVGCRIVQHRSQMLQGTQKSTPDSLQSTLDSSTHHYRIHMKLTRERHKKRHKRQPTPASAPRMPIVQKLPVKVSQTGRTGKHVSDVSWVFLMPVLQAAQWFILSSSPAALWRWWPTFMRKARWELKRKDFCLWTFKSFEDPAIWMC